MRTFQTLDDVDVQGKRVLVRADLNVPLKNGKVIDTSRIDKIIPTLQELKSKNARIILISHMGRPKGQRVPDLSLKQLVKLFPQATAIDQFANDCVGQEAQTAIAMLQPGQIALLENLRFHQEEENDDEEFAKQLVSFADIYVNDAFSVSHRAHASVHAITKFLPSVAGRLMEVEVEALTTALKVPQHPIMAIVAGAKISTKLEVLKNLVRKVDILVPGGGIANTLLFADGVNIGKSLCEQEMVEMVREIQTEASAANCKILLPLDAVVATEIGSDVPTDTVAIDAVPIDSMILDIGPKTVTNLSQHLVTCRTLIWNGPLGVFEYEPFAQGTIAVAQAVAELTNSGSLFSIAGGGETVAAIAQARCIDAFSYISTAGGAFLEYLEGKTLPGIAALQANF